MSFGMVAQKRSCYLSNCCNVALLPMNLLWSLLFQNRNNPLWRQILRIELPRFLYSITRGTRLDRYLVDFATNGVVWGPCHIREKNVFYSKKLVHSAC